MKKYQAQLVTLAMDINCGSFFRVCLNPELYLDKIYQALDFLFEYSSQGDCPGYTAQMQASHHGTSHVYVLDSAEGDLPGENRRPVEDVHIGSRM